jgi:quinoprotein glucose dehydrogenase
VPPARGAGGGGRGAGGGGGGRGAGAGPAAPASYKDASPGTSTIAGISILKPRELGGITAYNMNTGDKAWWIPNGGRMIQPTVNQNSPDAALFANVKLPMVPARGQQSQVINTRTLVIYGTGRSGAPAEDGTNKLFAVDKATGKQLGAVTIPGNTSAVPMTFMHQGKQYIVFATGAGQNTALVALALPAAK